MVLVALALAAASAAGQTAPDARTLLQAVADAAQAAKTWQVEGEIVTETQSEFASSSSRQPFRLFKDGPRVRCEVSGPRAQTWVFDGAVLWDYTPRDNTFFKRNTTAYSPPVPMLYRVQGLQTNALMAGRDHVGSQACDVVRMETPPTVRTLCIDRERKLVLRDRADTLSPPTVSFQGRTVQTITYLAIQRDVPIDAGLFAFAPPSLATERSRLPASSPCSDDGGVFDIGGTRLSLLAKVEPVYTDEARAAKVEGTVDLYVEIGLDGLASGIWVQRGLGYGLDEKAIEAVRQWRFQPGMRNGEPVTGTATIEVQFQMFHSPPRR